MSATLLKGKAVSEAVMAELAKTVQSLPYAPRLEMIRVGEDPASVIYGRGKTRAAEAIGIRSNLHVLRDDAQQGELMALIERLNDDPDVDGILMQLPMPGHLDPEPVLEAIDPDKDVDGLHTVSIGRLWSGQKGLLPCTPAGLIRIMDYYELPIEGKHAVVVGRSNLVGKPAAGLFLRRNATVSIAHSRTRDLADLTRQADILVAAVGSPAIIKADMVKPGAVVLDVGLTRIDRKIHGDVHPDVADVASHLTPMPGGTGVMTVTMLMQNTVDAAMARRGRVGAS